MNDTDSFKASELLKIFFSQLEDSKFKKANAIINGWKNIIISVCNDGKNNGQKLADHSRVIDLKNNILQIETDHPGWIQLFSLYQGCILRELKNKFPELDIRAISFKLRDS